MAFTSCSHRARLRFAYSASGPSLRPCVRTYRKGGQRFGRLPCCFASVLFAFSVLGGALELLCSRATQGQSWECVVRLQGCSWIAHSVSTIVLQQPVLYVHLWLDCAIKRVRWVPIIWNMGASVLTCIVRRKDSAALPRILLTISWVCTPALPALQCIAFNVRGCAG